MVDVLLHGFGGVPRPHGEGEELDCASLAGAADLARFQDRPSTLDLGLSKVGGWLYDRPSHHDLDASGASAIRQRTFSSA